MHIGSAIRTIRRKLSLSQLELSQKCEITQTALSQIEVGLKKPSQRTLEKLCKALEIPEFLIWVLAIEQDDVPHEKQAIYNVVYPVMQDLLLQMAQPAELEVES